MAQPYRSPLSIFSVILYYGEMDRPQHREIYTAVALRLAATPTATNWKAPAHVCQHSRTQGPEEVARRYALLFFGFFSAGFFSAGFFSAGFFTSAGVSGFRADTTIEGIGIMNL